VTKKGTMSRMVSRTGTRALQLLLTAQEKFKTIWRIPKQERLKEEVSLFK
jgi:hypothetical protein